MINHLEFFSSHGVMSSPNKGAGLFEQLPDEIGSLCRIIQGLVIHIIWAEQYGVQLAEPRREEVQLRSVARKLERIVSLDPRPLSEVRIPENRLVGNCRDFSLMLTAMLRHQGTPARARCGFSRYFIPNHYEDHWVCEYWSSKGNRWVLVDPQLDALHCDKLKIEFSPSDVPRDQYVVAGKAWQLCRTGQADPQTFGIFDMKGLWFICSNLVRDVASLNKMELLPWDSWGIIKTHDDALSADDMALLDQVAELTSGEVPEFEIVRQLYERDDRLRVPRTIRSYTHKGVRTVDLADT